MNGLEERKNESWSRKPYFLQFIDIDNEKVLFYLTISYYISYILCTFSS